MVFFGLEEAIPNQRLHRVLGSVQTPKEKKKLYIAGTRYIRETT